MPDIQQMLSLARQAMGAKDIAGATAQYRKVLESAENAEALLHLSNTEARSGHYREGRDYALRALRAAVGNPALTPSVLLCLRHFEEAGPLHKYIEQSDFLHGMADPRTLQLVSAQLSWMGDQTQAIEFISSAIRWDPQMAFLRLARAQMEIFMGDFDAAQRDLESCLRSEQDQPNVYWTLAQVRKWTADNNHVDAIRRVLQKQGLPPLERTRLQYALHKELDDMGDIPGAFAALDAACKLQRPSQQYSSEENRRLFSKLKAIPVRKFEQPQDFGFTPVFVVGMFRSGTTLLEQLLGGHPGVLNAGELHDMAACMRYATDHYFPGATDEVTVDRAGGIDFAEVGRQYMEGVRWRLDGHDYLTDKWPPNHMNVGFICQALPTAKIIHMSRDPRETCFSNLRELFGFAAPYSYDQLELADYCNQYRDLMEHWHQRFPGRILDVSYADLTRNTEATMRKVAEFCGFPFTEKLLQPNSEGKSVATASAVQIRGKVVARDVPKWAPYEKYLQPLLGALR